MSQISSPIDLLLFEHDSLDMTTSGRTRYFMAKRVVDFVVSLGAVIILAPVFLLLFIIIPLDSHGPALYVQERVGARRRKINGRYHWEKIVFNCYKFRTMVANADTTLHKEFVKALIDQDSEKITSLRGEESKTHKLTKDPRVTRIGKLLRKTSLDELPQLINVIKNEMSLVGPRPAIPYEIEMYKPWYFSRLDTLPGITGWWQVEARSEVGFEEMVKLDLEYIRRQSFWFDLMIIIKTPLVVISTKGAK
jgi:lipopolysaccharide/colanic/teichoic acid biosynthesis glycosyltransferase